MGIMSSLIAKLFEADAPAPPDATKLDGTTEAALAAPSRHCQRSANMFVQYLFWVIIGHFANFGYVCST